MLPLDERHAHNHSIELFIRHVSAGGTQPLGNLLPNCFQILSVQKISFHFSPAQQSDAAISLFPLIHRPAEKVRISSEAPLVHQARVELRVSND
jgi:hypothetical protein